MVIRGAEGTPGVRRGTGQRSLALETTAEGGPPSGPPPRLGQGRALQNGKNPTQEGRERLQAHGLQLGRNEVTGSSQDGR